MAAGVLGIDIGGTGVKAAPVDPAAGTLLAARQRLETPSPATPDAVAEVIAQLVKGFNWTGRAGVTFPGVVVDGVIRTAANLDHAWIGLDAAKFLGAATGLDVTVVNDADAAGVAEIKFGAGKGQPGTVLLLTLGTGIGSALFSDGVLVPNTEFGHIQIRGKDAEKRASEQAREARDLSWGDWAGRVDEYLEHMEALLSPSLIIIGGGISKKSDKFLPRLSGLRAKIVPAAMLNDAGIVGAAMSADVD
jgi:polyphosphate glucokinase